MTNSRYHWCPSGCGKKVTHIARDKYSCAKCGKEFTKEELDEWKLG